MRRGRSFLRSAGLMVGLAFAMVVVGLGVLHADAQALRTQATWWALISGILILVTLTAGLATFEWARRAGAPTAGRTRRTRRTARPVGGRFVRLAVVTGSLSGLVMAVVYDGSVPLSTFQSMVNRSLWVALGVTILVTVRSRWTSGWIAAALPLVLPPGVFLVAAGLSGAVTSSLTPAITVLSVPLLTGAVIALVVVPAVLISSAVNGLRDLQDRGLRLARLVEPRPWTVPVVLATNLVLIGLVFLVGRWTHPDRDLWRSDAAVWVAAVLVAAALVGCLTLESRLGLTAGDQAAAGKLLALLAAVPVGALVLLTVGAVVLIAGLTRPLVLCSLLLLVVAVLVVERFFRGRRRLGYLVVILIAALLSEGHRLAPGAVLTPQIPQWTQPAGSGNAITSGTITVLTAALAAAVLAIIAYAVVSGRKRLLLYLGAVASWVLALTAMNAWAEGGSILSIDLVLTGLLGVMTWLWLRHRQVEVDGFEVVLTVVVTSALWLLPQAVELAPDPLSRWVVVAAVVAPGAAALWGEVRALRRATPQRTELALWCVCYGLLAALAWTIGGGGAGLPDNLSSLVADYGLPPLAILFILAASAGRRRVSPQPDQRPAAARSQPS